MYTSDHLSTGGQASPAEPASVQLIELATTLIEHRRLLLLAPVLVGAVALGLSFLVTPTYTSRTTFLVPQQQSGTSAALASLGALANLAGNSAVVKTAGDQYVSLMQSVNVEDRVIDKLGLMEEYKAKHRSEGRLALERNVRITLGKKDGLITVEADASKPDLAAAIANLHVEELRRLTSELALTEAQQRRVFFEQEVKKTKDRLATAQQSLQESGFNANALKAEPKAAADAYAKLKADVTSAEVRLQTLRRTLTESAPEVLQQAGMLSALRDQLIALERSNKDGADAGYVGRYREYKYQETLYDLFSRQYEMARVDESRDGALLQVVDVATPPEHKSKPKRSLIAIIATLGTGVLLGAVLTLRSLWRRYATDPANEEQVKRLRSAWKRR